MKRNPSLVSEAFSLAETLHRGQSRKSTDIPYLYHLLSVAALVGEYGGSERQVAAALLHDAAEDQGGHEALKTIEAHLGKEIASYVLACSDSTNIPKPPWRARKEAFIERIGQLPPEVKLIVAADKLHNVLSLLRDYRQVGESLWQRFSGRRAGTLWYYKTVTGALAEKWAHPILDELQDAVELLLTRVSKKKRL
ncbi:MAG TPA: HD domain-containing protein [Candidatus Hydrogenedentes bacterium]|nr:HD domain-containing protein [Candidatus Hydrogenedentota bacterium]HQH53101.1 HD domain-containing protein [Candidatus Hydrogenedentota bacterium]HQM51168.1 HD domain-containing protein [Candidatus Hydrogenedentota bacterium]